MELIYQEEKEVKPVYDMYQKIFEDPEEFAKYYFEEVYASNEVLLAREGQKILGMIHLNPYHIRTGEKTYTLNYIVAVAGMERIQKTRNNGSNAYKVLK